MVRDVTSSMACFALWGPAARDVLSAVCADDLTFPYMQARAVTVGDVPCWALRVTYVGELGWELYPAIEYGVRLWDTLLEAGRPLGLVPGGYRAIDSLRVEKGYRVWGADITSETDPYSSGLGFAVRAGREFLGEVALARCVGRTVAAGVSRARRPAVGRARQRARAGRRRSRRRARLERWPRLLARTVDRVRVAAGRRTPTSAPRLSVEVFGETVGAVVTAEPLFDPAGHRIRA